MGAKIYCVCNQKGGVGKTVTSVNLGIGLARLGRKVLLVDMDSQGSLTVSLGYQQTGQIEITLADALKGIIEDEAPPMRHRDPAPWGGDRPPPGGYRAFLHEGYAGEYKAARKKMADYQTAKHNVDRILGLNPDRGERKGTER